MKHGSSVHERYSVQYIKGFDMSCVVAFKSPSRSIGDGIQIRICRSVGLLDARVGHCRTARSSWGSFLVSIEPRRRFAFFFMSQNVPCCMSQRVRSNYICTKSAVSLLCGIHAGGKKTAGGIYCVPLSRV